MCITFVNKILKSIGKTFRYIYISLQKKSIVEPKIKISDYSYELPENRIAKYPLPQRDSSKLLVYRNGNVSHFIFHDISTFLPENSLMVYNNTKVVPARLFFRKDTGAVIEVFCLEPVQPADYVQSFASVGSCRWKAVLGNSKRWKGGRISFICDYNTELNNDINKAQALNLQAELISKGDAMANVVEFSWEGSYTFSEVLDICGRIPIPPYLNRETEQSDIERYQTLYAQIKGSVAAPTAGLHFTDRVLADIKNKGIEEMSVCLHVGAGTFIPVKSEYISGHKMHTEPISVTRELLVKLLEYKRKGRVIAVGTTSTRTLESLYYFGVHCIERGEPGSVEQWEPYSENENDDCAETCTGGLLHGISVEDSLSAIIGYMDRNGLTSMKARTGIIIVPGYKYKIVDVLITNFHQPQSTLLLLISAFVGEEHWREIYRYALDNDFRFLSYGDSSLLFGKNRI